jgi:hypothetical protein
MIFPGSRAKSRTAEKLPVLIFRLDFSPVDRTFLIKLESDQKSDDRAFKLVNRNKNPFSAARDPGPDDDTIIPCDATEVTPGHWRLTPKNELAPGEYGLFFRFMIWGFGVDPA